MNLIQIEAARLVKQVMEGGNLDQALQASLRAQPRPRRGGAEPSGAGGGATRLLPQSERGALQDLSYGTLRFLGRLQFFLDRLLTRQVRDPLLSCLMLVALYQLEYSKSAKHVIVDQAVRAAKQRNPATGALVNAVLRNFLRQREGLRRQADEDPASRHAYPRWWIAMLQAEYGDQAESILAEGNRHPPMTLRVNPRYVTAETYLSMLAEVNMDARLVEPGALMLAQPVAVERLPKFSAGWVSVQDAGAQYAARLLDATAGMRVLDACAAPGGKSAHLLERADIELVAVDKNEERLQRVRQNLQRLNLQAQLVCGDAAAPESWWDGRPFQRILADVPCSASGVVRRHPDIKWLRRPADIGQFASQQAQILEALWRLLAVDGKLLYATCSVFAQENGQVIAAFLQAHPEAERESLPLPSVSGLAGQLLPNDVHDGFFYALLHKKY